MAGRKRTSERHGRRQGNRRREGWVEGRPDKPTARRGRNQREPYWIYGQHAVAAACANPERQVLRLLCTADPEPPPHEQKPEIIDRRGLEEHLPMDAVHQGIAAQVAPLDHHDLETLLADESRSGVVLVLDQISDPRNVGAILRSAAAFGVIAVIMQDRHAPQEGGALAKAASGALELVPLVRVNNLARALEQLAGVGFWRHGLAKGEGRSLTDLDLNGRIALVLGAEGDGLRPLTRRNCDSLVHLPMDPAMDSLNVSATAAIALFLAYTKGH
jgi:23S rRNA (guanosine2251-2'-O)-methyltransferase